MKTRKFMAGSLLFLGVLAGTAGSAFAQVGQGAVQSPTATLTVHQLSCTQSAVSSVHVLQPTVCVAPK
jgi:hypothetical protein